MEGRFRMDGPQWKAISDDAKDLIRKLLKSVDGQIECHEMAHAEGRYIHLPGYLCVCMGAGTMHVSV